MFSVYKLQAKVFLKGPTVVFLFFLSFVYLFVFGSVVKYSGASETAQLSLLLVVFGTVTALTIMNTSFNNFGYSFFDMKNSVLIKRIGSTKLTKFDLLAAFILWGITIIFIAVIWMFAIMTFLSMGVDYFPQFSYSTINWVGLLYAIIVGSAASFSVALFLISISSTTEVYNTYSTLYFFFFAAFGGLFTPANTPQWMIYIGYLSPITWTSSLIGNSMQGASVFHFGGYDVALGAAATAVPAWKATLTVLMPLFYCALFLGITVRTFKWDS